MPLQDEALARRAATGDAGAFGTLYDRYERRAYNLCYRITGSPDDAADATQETFLKVFERLPQLEGRELNFAAYVMTAARHASYDAIERRKRSAPTGEIPDAAVPLGGGAGTDPPERAALREAHQEQIRLANESLPARQREVLALRELGELSYGEVAQIMGMNQNSVAQLISRARINLRDGLRQTALGSVASASPQCDRALPLLALHQDGRLEDPWLADHLIDCGACRVRLGAMEEAAVAYRQWLLLVPALWLRESTAEAAERVNAGWHRPSRRRRLLVAGPVALLLLLALAFLTADGAQSPTRAYAPASIVPASEPVVAVDEAAKPVERRTRRAPKPRVRAKQRKAVTRPRSTGGGTAPKEVASTAGEPADAEPAARQIVGRPAERAAPRRRVRPRPEPKPVDAAVVADPPAGDPEQPDDPVTPPDPPDPAPCPNCPAGGGTVTSTPPCSSTSAAGCPPPPPPPVVTCQKCGLVAPSPKPPVPVDPKSVKGAP